VSVTATAAVQEMARRHGVVGLPAVALGRAATAGLLLATLTKNEEQVTLQVLGDGPLAGVTIDARSSGKVRGFVKRPQAVTWDPALAAAPRLAVGEAIGKRGVVGVTRDLGMEHNYSGQVALETGEIDEEVERYLITSEQIDSVLRCETLVDTAGQVTAAAGLLVQTLPQAQGAPVVAFLRDVLAGPVFGTVLRGALERGELEPEAIARAALGQCAERLEMLDVREVGFSCPCSRERAQSTLAMLRLEDLEQMVKEDHEAEVSCNFCGATYRFSEPEVDALRRQAAKPRAQG